jgi:tetratricopeptide (TPR) repeat protein
MKSNWLEIAEYISLAGSVVGSAVAVASQQIIYAAAPVSASLLLNLANRRRLEQMAPPNSRGEVAQVHQQLTQEVDALRTSVRQLPTQAELSGIKQALQTEIQRLEDLKTREGAASPEDLSQLQIQYSNLLEAIASVSTRLEELSPASQVKALEASLANTVEDLAHLETEVSQLQSALQNLPTQVPAALVSGDIATTAIEPQLQELKLALQELEYTRVSRQDFMSLVTATTVLERAITPVATAISEIRQRVDDLTGQVNRQNGEALQETTLRQLEAVRNALEQLDRRIELETRNLGTLATQQANPAALGQIEEVLAKITQSVAETKAEMETRIAALERLDLQAIPQEITLLREQSATLLEAAANQTGISSSSLNAKVTEIEQAIAELVQQIASLPTEATSASVSTEPAIEQQLNLLRSAIAQLETTTLQVSPAEFESVVSSTHQLEQAIEPINLAILELRTQLDEARLQMQRSSEQIMPANEIESMLAELNVAVNQLRRRIDEVEANIPEPADLTGVEGILAKIAQSVAEAKYQTETALSPIWDRIAQLQTELEQSRQTIPHDLHLTLNSLLQQLETVTQRVDEINRHIDQIPPPQTFDLSEIESSLAKIVESVAETKTQLERRLSEVERQNFPLIDSVSDTVNQLQDQIATFATRAEVEQKLRDVQSLVSEVRESTTGVSFDWRRLDEELQNLRSQVQSLPVALQTSRTTDLVGIEGVLEHIAQAVAEARNSLESRIAPLEEERINTTQIAELQTAVDRLQSDLETLASTPTSSLTPVYEQIDQLRTNLEHLASRPQSVPVDSTQIENIVKQTVETHLAEINQLLGNLQSWEFQLVFDRPGIRGVLEEALETAQQQLTLVCPWVSHESLDHDLMQKIEAFLQRQGQLEIGWGNLKDINVGNFPRRMSRQWQTQHPQYDALNDLEQLQVRYPHQIQLKILGTNENYLVIDRSRAMLTTHNFLTTGAGFPEREVALVTTDPRIIQGLLDRFDDPLLNPSSAYAYRKRGFERLDSGDYRAAIEDYTQALAIDPHNANAYNNRGVAHAGLREQSAAILDYNQAIQLHHNEPTFYFNRGFAHYNLGEYQLSIQDYTQVLQLVAPDAETYFHRAEAYRRLGNYQQAIADYTQTLQLNPEDAIAYNNRGLARFDLGDLQGAIADYSHALEINPDDAVTYLNRGLSYWTNAQPAQALADFDYALSLNPEYALAYNHRAFVRLHHGDRKGAITDLQQSAQLFAAQGDLESSQQALNALTNL